ncbi:dihydroorotase [Runella limosa]|jgi:dihydroorotase|uniref:dihydroorotase n=1 Tax=Runella limosa TaxID=370978 RepID=UPI00041448C9|nr:dihydroorotase [Runella limosa]
MLLIRSVKITDTHSPYNGQIKDILVENGQISQIADHIEAANAQVLEGENWHISPGWVDMRVHAYDPGYEQKEDLRSACAAAAVGGFTDIAVLPNAKPALDSKDTLVYVKHRALGQVVNVHPIGAVTKSCEGKDFTEMIDLSHAGAVAFSDGSHPIYNTHILLKSLQYLQQVDRVLMNRPEDYDLTVFGQMNEGEVSTLLGMRGIPTIAEELMVMRDLKMLEYMGIKSEAPLLHFSTISTATTVGLIRAAKAKGYPVSCDVAAHQIAFDDSALLNFDTNYKVNPPFRAQSDIEAIWEGLADGTIDAVVSDHNPQDEESKNLEFDLAEFGIIGLETAFAVLNTYNTQVPLDQLIGKLTHQPRAILRLPSVAISEANVANFTIFNPDLEWIFKETRSKSKNSPFFGTQFKGKTVYVINQGLVEKCG